MAGEVRGVWVLRTDPTTHSLRLAEGGNWKAAGRLEHPVDSFPRPARLGLRSPPGSADSVPANALAGASSPALLSREVGRGQLQQLEVPPPERKWKEGKKRPE